MEATCRSTLQGWGSSSLKSRHNTSRCGACMVHVHGFPVDLMTSSVTLLPGLGTVLSSV